MKHDASTISEPTDGSRPAWDAGIETELFQELLKRYLSRVPRGTRGLKQIGLIASQPIPQSRPAWDAGIETEYFGRTDSQINVASRVGRGD